MNIALVLVSSVNGKITDGKSKTIYEWTSKEDQEHFFSLLDSHSLIIMGRKTYEASKSVIRLVPNKLRIVLTNSPDSYKSGTVPGQLEFTKESPTLLIKRLRSQGYTNALIVGGSEIAALFFQSKLIDTLFLTIEPYLFGNGNQFFHVANYYNVDLQLQAVKRMNTKGTLILKYKILRNSMEN